LSWKQAFDIFQVVCFESIKHQTTHDFQWIVFADQDLDPSIRHDLEALLGTMENAVLVPTWDACRASYDLPQRRRDDDVQTILRIETSIEPTWGLQQQGIEEIQKTAVSYAETSRKSNSTTTPINLASTWWGFSFSNALKYYYYLDVLDEDHYKSTSIGSTKVGWMKASGSWSFPVTMDGSGTKKQCGHSEWVHCWTREHSSGSMFLEFSNQKPSSPLVEGHKTPDWNFLRDEFHIDKSQLQEISLEDDDSSNHHHHHPFEIVHVVNTRFMMGQANMTILGEARLKLFETFCLPTIINQSVQNFYWLILINPTLEASILRELRQLLDPIPNAYLILTDKPDWSKDGYCLDLQEVADMHRQGQLDIVTGNLRRLAAFDLHKGCGERPRLILRMDTILDADDGLHHQAFEGMQKTAIQYTQQEEPLNIDNNWWFMCIDEYYEFHNRNIFMMSSKNSSSVGSGLIGRRIHAVNCVSAGWTRVGSMMAPISDTKFPRKSEIHHSDLVWARHKCQKKRENLRHRFYSRCYERVFPASAMAIRCRTITSDSMDHVDKSISHYGDLPGQDPNTSPLLINGSEVYWKDLADNFYIDRQNAVDASRFMYEHFHEIAEENLKSKW
jgi:hypothetical protein